jgi:hypothetical protein
MLPAIHVDDSEGMGPAVIHDVNSFEIGDFDEFGAVGSCKLSCRARRFASRVGLELINLPLIVNGLCPRLEWNFLEDALRQSCSAAAPSARSLTRDGADDDPAIGPSGRRRRRRSRPLCASSLLSLRSLLTAA